MSSQIFFTRVQPPVIDDVMTTGYYIQGDKMKEMYKCSISDIAGE
jgi:hypothetical protein